MLKEYQSLQQHIFVLARDCYFSFNKTDASYRIRSPNYGNNNYDDNKVCGWLIESPEPAANIKITFLEFKIEIAKRCLLYDYVRFYKQENGKAYNDWTVVSMRVMFLAR